MSFHPCYTLGVLALVTASLLPAGDSIPPATRKRVTLLRIRVIEGDGAVHDAGSRSAGPLTVQVTDEVGRPVSGAAVSFQMPGDGPAGIFASGLSTEVLVTRADGQASVKGIRWGRATGSVPIRITASLGEARAGTISTQYVQALSESENKGKSRRPSISKPRGRWVAIAFIAAGAVAGGLALGVAGSSSAAASPAPTAASSNAALQQPPVQVGTPTISVGKP